MRVLSSLSGYRHSGTLYSPPYRACQHHRRVDNMISVYQANGKGYKKLGFSGRGSGEKSGVLGLGEFHDNRGAYTGRAGEMHSALMTVDNLLTDRQTQAGTALPLGAVERLKGTRQDFRGHAHACITKVQTHPLIRRHSGSNGEGTALWYGMPGIDEHIEEHLFELLGAAADERELRRHLQPDFDVLAFETRLQQTERIGQELLHRQRRHGLLLDPCKSQQLLNQPRNTISMLDDRVHFGGAEVTVAQLHPQEFGITRNNIEGRA